MRTNKGLFSEDFLDEIEIVEIDMGYELVRIKLPIECVEMF